MGYPKMSPMFAAGLGTFGARGEPPYPDALIVEEAIGEVATAILAIMSGDAHEKLVESADLAAGLGFKKLDVSGALDAGLANVRNLLLTHGALRSRPLIRLEPPEVRAKLADNGKPGVWRREEWMEPTWQDHAPKTTRFVEIAVHAKRKNVYPAGAYCRLEYEPGPQVIVNERGEYFAWRAGLAGLAERLHDAGLARYAALAPRAAERPWKGEMDGEPIRDLFQPGAEGVYAGDDARALCSDRAMARRRAVYGGATYRRRPAKPAQGELDEA